MLKVVRFGLVFGRELLAGLGLAGSFGFVGGFDVASFARFRIIRASYNTLPRITINHSGFLADRKERGAKQRER